MAKATMDGPKTPLGVGALLSDVFSVVFGNLFKVLLLGFTGALVGIIVSTAFFGVDFVIGASDPTVDPEAVSIGAVGSLVSTVLGLAIYGLVTALIIQLAYDIKLGRSNSLGAYLRAALPALVPIVLMTLVITILCALGFFALVVGALWIYAVYYVTVPVAVIERGGFGSMRRSAALTKEYRWPIVGLFVVMAIFLLVLQVAVGFLIGVLAAIGGGAIGQLLLLLLLAGVNGLAYGFGGTAVALVYARLREIKEGVAVDQIAAVFD